MTNDLLWSINYKKKWCMPLLVFKVSTSTWFNNLSFPLHCNCQHCRCQNDGIRLAAWVSGWQKWSCSVVSDSFRPHTVACRAPPSTGLFQARVLEWVAISFSRGSSQPRDQTQVSCIAGRRFTVWATRQAPNRQNPSPTSAKTPPPGHTSIFTEEVVSVTNFWRVNLLRLGWGGAIVINP